MFRYLISSSVNISLFHITWLDTSSTGFTYVRSVKYMTLYTGQWSLSPLQSKHLGTSHSSPNHHQLSRHIFLNLISGLKSLPFQRWFLFWEKPEVTGWQIWAVVGLRHLGDLMFCQKTLHKTWCVSGYVAVMKLLITSCP